MIRLLVVIVMALGLAGCAPASSKLVWTNGTPPELSPDNPYLPKLNAHVVRARQQLAKGKEEHPFYLVWGAAAPGSTHRDDKALRELALDRYDKATLDRVDKPQAFWAIYSDLEALLLWQLEGKVAKEKIVTWQQRLRPSIEANIKTVTDETSWISVAANTLLQSTAILQLAVESYGRTNPANPDLPRWRAQALANLAKARKIQLPGGAFSYIRDSGPDPCYFAFDTAHLGRFYQLTGNADARDSLIRLAGWAPAATRCGWVTPFSSPWWKHIVGPGGPYTGPETLTSLADDPLMRGVMAKRRSYIQPYVWSYGNMYGWEPTDGPVQPIGDRCTFDRNANGPALRRGGWDVEMPARAWGDSAFGASFATEKAITSCINAVYLAANKSADKPGVRPGQHAYIMLDEAAMTTNGSVVGDGWIAGANSFDAHVGLFGVVPPDSSPWHRTDLWYADVDGAAGSLEIRCTAADTIHGIELWISSNARELKVGTATVGFDDFTLHATGNRFGPGTFADKSTGRVYFPVAGSGPRQYQPGERFTARVNVTRPDHPALTVTDVTTAGKVVVVDVSKNGLLHARLVYNTGDRPAQWTAPRRGTAWGKSKRSVTAGQRMTIGPRELIVVK